MLFHAVFPRKSPATFGAFEFPETNVNILDVALLVAFLREDLATYGAGEVVLLQCEYETN